MFVMQCIMILHCLAMLKVYACLVLHKALLLLGRGGGGGGG